MQGRVLGAVATASVWETLGATLPSPIDAWIAPARNLFPPTDVLAPEGE